MRQNIQKRMKREAIREEDIISVLESRAMDVAKVRHLWVLANTGNAANDAFRDAVFNVFRHTETSSKAEILEEYERQQGEPCPLTTFVMRGLMREVAEKGEGESWVLKK